MKHFCFVLIDLFAWPPAYRLGPNDSVDGSGSMEGFAKTGALTQLVTEISVRQRSPTGYCYLHPMTGKQFFPPKR